MRSLTGKVVSTKMKKTVVVEITKSTLHPIYKKILKSSMRLKAHNENEDLKDGDMVEIHEIKPMSKEKHFKVVKKV
jgi:small subunit ribosomal protein S17